MNAWDFYPDISKQEARNRLKLACAQLSLRDERIIGLNDRVSALLADSAVLQSVLNTAFDRRRHAESQVEYYRSACDKLHEKHSAREQFILYAMFRRYADWRIGRKKR